VDFEPRLRAYLESLSSAPAPRVQLRSIDAMALYGHLLEQLRKAEADGSKVWWIERIHREWTPGHVRQFAAYLETVSSPLAPRDAQSAREFAFRALDQAIDCLDPGVGTIDRLELHRVAGGFATDQAHPYALENRLVAGDAQRGYHVTHVGRSFLRLRGRDAIRWLLTVEVSQSTGRWDSWRASRSLLERALTGVDVPLVDGERRLSYASQTLDRLVELAVLTCWSHDEYDEPYRYAVQDGMHDLVRSVLEPSPWQTAIAALLEDETATVLHGRSAGAADAASELTKLITHEIRNALVPVRHHIDAIRTASPDPSTAARVDKVRRGVVRVLEFVDELVATTDLVGDPKTSCDIFDVLREAISGTDGGERVELVPGGPHRIRAPRSRLVLALRNLVLNALQATEPAGPVRASFHANQASIEIVVDDGGAGVPSQLRTIVFDDGYTTRGGIGHGFGLASVRRFVEEALRGKVWCEDSDLGGARFVISLAAELGP
jgi:signal transduction histidine kinase